MSTSVPAPVSAPTGRAKHAPRAVRLGVWRRLGQNPSFVLGVALIVLLLGFALVGRIFVDSQEAYPLSAPPSMPPDATWPFGTDADGRDLFAVIIYGTLLTLKIGVIAGCLGLGIGTSLAFISAYRGGWLDIVLRVLVDVLITIPTLLVLVVIASVIHGSINTTTMGLIIALLAWREPTRQIRSQVLVMREAQYVKLAVLNGASAARIIFFEMMPNLLPFLGANLVVAISQAVLASIGLEALGLGSPSEPTLGLTIYWMMNESAFLLGMWWWIIEPIAVLIMLFVGLFLLTSGLDELANPRLRRPES